MQLKEGEIRPVKKVRCWKGSAGKGKSKITLNRGSTMD